MSFWKNYWLTFYYKGIKNWYKYIMAELCFHRFVHFDCVPIYIFGFHNKHCAGDKKDFTFVKFTSQSFSSADESLKEETHLLLLWDGLVATLHTLCSYIYIFRFHHSSADESLKDENHLLLIWDGSLSLVTQHTLCSWVLLSQEVSLSLK